MCAVHPEQGAPPRRQPQPRSRATTTLHKEAGAPPGGPASPPGSNTRPPTPCRATSSGRPTWARCPHRREPPEPPRHRRICSAAGMGTSPTNPRATTPPAAGTLPPSPPKPHLAAAAKLPAAASAAKTGFLAATVLDHDPGLAGGSLRRRRGQEKGRGEVVAAALGFPPVPPAGEATRGSQLLVACPQVK